jgi:hypothetical protein
VADVYDVGNYLIMRRDVVFVTNYVYVKKIKPIGQHMYTDQFIVFGGCVCVCVYGV